MCKSGMGDAEILDYMNSGAHRKKEFIRKVSEIVQLMSQGENTMTSDRWIKNFLVTRYNYIEEMTKYHQSQTNALLPPQEIISEPQH